MVRPADGGGAVATGPAGCTNAAARTRSTGCSSRSPAAAAVASRPAAGDGLHNGRRSGGHLHHLPAGNMSPPYPAWPADRRCSRGLLPELHRHRCQLRSPEYRPHRRLDEAWALSRPPRRPEERGW